MLLNHRKHRSHRSSHAKSSPNDVSIWKLMKGDSKEAPEPSEEEKNAYFKMLEAKSQRLEKALVDSRKELKIKTIEKKGTPVISLKGQSPFKKRVDEFFNRHESISLQQKLKSLAPTTINNVTITATRNNPLTTTSFLIAPYDKKTKVDKRFNTPNIQRDNTAKLSQRFLLSRTVSHQENMLSSSEEDASEKFYIRPPEKYKGKRVSKNKSLSQDIIDALDRTGHQVSSYNSIEKDIDALIDKSLKANMYPSNRNFLEYSKIKVESQTESEPNFNFKVVSNKNLSNTDSEFQPKEGSFLKHLRTQSVQPSLFPTKPQAGEPSAKSSSKKILAENRAKSAQNNRHKSSNNSIANDDTGFGVSNIFESCRSPEKPKSIISDKPTNSRHQRIIDTQINNRMVSPFLSGVVTQKSMVSIFAPKDDQSRLNNESQNREFNHEDLNISAIESPQQNLMSKSQIQDITLENITETQTKSDKSMAVQETKSLKETHPEKKTNTLHLQFLENPTVTRNMNELIVYAKGKSQILKDIIRHDTQEIKSMKNDTFCVEEAFAEARISFIQGGLSQKYVKLDGLEKEKEIPLLLNEDIKDVRTVREVVNNVNNKFGSLEQKKEQLYEQHHDKLEQAKIVTPQRLTNYEISLIRKELEKNSEDIDIEKIDLSLKKLRFFSQLTDEIRSKFYSNAQYFKFEKDAYIYRKGDPGDLMYVILRGNVTIKDEKVFRNGHSQSVTTHSLNDGAHFGDLAVISEKYRKKQSKNPETKAVEANNNKSTQKATTIPEKLAELTKLMNQTFQKTPKSEFKPNISTNKTLRQTSAQCAEETEVIAINQEIFQDIIFSDAQNGLDEKIEVLQISYFFTGEESFNLMPIANILKTVKFKLGQQIIKAGDLINNFYTVAKGRCKVISQIADGYPLDLDMFKQKLRSLKFKAPEKPHKNKRESQPNTQKVRETSGLQKRIFDREPLIVHDINDSTTSTTQKSKKFVHHVKHSELTRGDCFGIRSLLSTEDEDSPVAVDVNLIAKLTVVADTSDVEVYVLPRISLILVPEEIRNNLLNMIAETNDFDELDTIEEIMDIRRWRKCQLGIIKKALTKTDENNLSLVHTTYKAT